MTSWVYLPEQLRSHPAIADTELYAYRTGNRMILPPSADVVRALDVVLERLSAEEDEAWVYAHFLKFRVNEWVGKYGTYAGFGEHPVPPTKPQTTVDPPSHDAVQQTKQAPSRAALPRFTTDIDDLQRQHQEVYHNVAKRVSGKKLRPRAPVSDKELRVGSGMYLCKKTQKWYNVDPQADAAIMSEFEMALGGDVEGTGRGMGSVGSSGSSGSGSSFGSGSSGKSTF